MTREEIKEYYKVINVNKVNEDITKIDLYHAEGDNNRHVCLLFAFNKLYYTGDMGTFVFGNFVHNIRKFFKGSEILPSYWLEKCEASSSPLIEQRVPEEKARKELRDFLQENYEEFFVDRRLSDYTEDVKDLIEDCFMEWNEEPSTAFSLIFDLFTELQVEHDFEDVGYIISRCQDYSPRYIYACNVIQWIENEYMEI